jgi:hypothetical protein
VVNLIKISPSIFKIVFTMGSLKRLLLSLLLIGFLFNVFHDFIFYKIDPCMGYAVSIVKVDEKPSDPLCKIHHELHQSYVKPEVEIKIPFISAKFSFLYQKPPSRTFPKSIFKPPKLA